jgi:hypothetical protein
MGSGWWSKRHLLAAAVADSFGAYVDYTNRALNK